MSGYAELIGQLTGERERLSARVTKIDDVLASIAELSSENGNGHHAKANGKRPAKVVAVRPGVRVMTCGKCGGTGHNARGCKGKRSGMKSIAVGGVKKEKGDEAEWME